MMPQKRFIKTMGIMFGIGLLYYIEIQTLGFTIPCLFFIFTGFQCPACGITRAILLLLKGELLQAMACNWGVALALPVLIPFLSVLLVRRLLGKSNRHMWVNVIGGLLSVYLLAWGILRNIMHL